MSENIFMETDGRARNSRTSKNHFDLNKINQLIARKSVDMSKQFSSSLPLKKKILLAE